MSQPLLVVLVALASFRAWRLLSEDTLLDGVRERFYTRFPPDEAWADHRARVLAVKRQKPVTIAKPSKVGILVDCPWCAGWWLCGLVTLAAWAWCGLRYPLLVWPGASTAVGFMGKLDGLGN